MNTDQLMDSLSENDPNPGTVLSLVSSKRRTARNRMYAASGGLAVVVVAVVAGIALQGLNPGGLSSSSASGIAAGNASAPVRADAGASQPQPAASPGARIPQSSSSAGSGSTASCAATPLKAQLAAAVKGGSSVIVGYATVRTSSLASRSPGGLLYYTVTLGSVRTLDGPTVRSGSTALVPTGTNATGASVTTEGQSLWAAGGEFFGILAPAAKGSASAAGAPVLRLTPVVSGQVIFSLDECWNVDGLSPRPYHGVVSRYPLGDAKLPLNGEFGASGTVTGDLSAVPLATVEKLVPSR